MRVRDFWRSAAADSLVGFRFVVGMCVFWVGPVLFAAIGLMSRPQRWDMVVWAAVAAAGLILGLGAPDTANTAALARLFAMCALNGLIAIPAAWAATLPAALA